MLCLRHVHANGSAPASANEHKSSDTAHLREARLLQERRAEECDAAECADSWPSVEDTSLCLSPSRLPKLPSAAAVAKGLADAIGRAVGWGGSPALYAYAGESDPHEGAGARAASMLQS